jgi:hypothetical protein
MIDQKDSPLNIKDFSIETPGKPEAVVDPGKKYLDETDFRNVQQIIRSSGDEYFRMGPRHIAELSVLFPSRKEDIHNEEKAQSWKNDFRDGVEENSERGDYINYLSGYILAFPEKRSRPRGLEEYYSAKLNERSTMPEQILPFFLLRMLEIFPEKRSELLTPEYKNKALESLRPYLDFEPSTLSVPYNPGILHSVRPAIMFSEAAVAMRLLFPEEFKKRGISDREWGRMNATLMTTPNSLNFTQEKLQLAYNMTLLEAHDVKLAENGIEIVQPSLPVAETLDPPITRKF